MHPAGALAWAPITNSLWVCDSNWPMSVEPGHFVDGLLLLLCCIGSVSVFEVVKGTTYTRTYICMCACLVLRIFADRCLYVWMCGLWWLLLSTRRHRICFMRQKRSGSHCYLLLKCRNKTFVLLPHHQRRHQLRSRGAAVSWLLSLPLDTCTPCTYLTVPFAHTLLYMPFLSFILSFSVTF